MGYTVNSVEILRRTWLPDGRELIRFRITKEEIEEGGRPTEESWVSHRILDAPGLRARGVREQPMYPFLWWILDISYERLTPGRMRMTWTQDFSIDPQTGHTDEEIEGYINRGSKQELERVRVAIETERFDGSD